MPALVILNPYSARWKAGSRLPEIEAALRAAGFEYRLEVTNSPRHAVDLAARGVREGYTPLVAAGGDGLIGEVVNGIARAAEAGPWPPLGILPLGTANDLADNLGLPRDLSEAVTAIAGGNSRPIDVLQVNGYHFVNNAGLGLESYISVIQHRMRRVRGVARYLVATLTGIAHNPRWNMELHWDDGSYQGPVTLVSVGNCPRTGGIFYTVPHADPFDGKLTFVFGFIPTRRQILRVLPGTMKSGDGSYVEHPAVQEHHTTRLRVLCAPPSPMHADGEVWSESVRDLEYRVLPARLPILGVGARGA